MQRYRNFILGSIMLFVLLASACTFGPPRGAQQPVAPTAQPAAPAQQPITVAPTAALPGASPVDAGTLRAMQNQVGDLAKDLESLNAKIAQGQTQQQTDMASLKTQIGQIDSSIKAYQAKTPQTDPALQQLSQQIATLQQQINNLPAGSGSTTNPSAPSASQPQVQPVAPTGPQPAASPQPSNSGGRWFHLPEPVYTGKGKLGVAIDSYTIPNGARGMVDAVQLDLWDSANNRWVFFGNGVITTLEPGTYKMVLGDGKIKAILEGRTCDEVKQLVSYFQTNGFGLTHVDQDNKCDMKSGPPLTAGTTRKIAIGQHLPAPETTSLQIQP